MKARFSNDRFGFKRDFSKLSDLPPQKWIVRRRLEAAHALIQSGRRKVTEICFSVGWGSIVTKRFDEPNVILAGIPAKVVKRGVNWNRKCINKYVKRI